MLHQDCIVTCDAFLSQSDIKKHTHFHNTSSSSQGFSYFVTTTKRVHHAPIQPPLFQSNDCSKTCQIFISITSHLKAEMCHRQKVQGGKEEGRNQERERETVVPERQSYGRNQTKTCTRYFPKNRWLLFLLSLSLIFIFLPKIGPSDERTIPLNI